jgi:hypothetical protein
VVWSGKVSSCSTKSISNSTWNTKNLEKRKSVQQVVVFTTRPEFIRLHVWLGWWSWPNNQYRWSDVLQHNWPGDFSYCLQCVRLKQVWCASQWKCAEQKPVDMFCWCHLCFATRKLVKFHFILLQSSSRVVGHSVRDYHFCWH